MVWLAGIAALAALTSSNSALMTDNVSCTQTDGLHAQHASIDITVTACLDYGELTVFLTREQDGTSVPVQWLRIYGRPTYQPEGPDVEIYADRTGQGPIDLTWNGETAPLFIGDFNGDGHDALAVGGFVEEPTLILYTLKDDPFEFLGRVFFSHGPEFRQTPYLAAWGISEIALGNPITVCDGRGRLRRYEAPDEYSYQLSFDSLGTESDCRAP